MASVHRRKGTKYWHGMVSLPGGKLLFRSTGQMDREVALRIAREWERVAKGEAPASAEQARRVITDIVKMALGAVGGRMSARGYVERWLGAVETTVSRGTMDFYRSTLGAWLSWLGARAERPLDAVQREDIVAWRAAEAVRVRAKTANHRLKAVRQLFKSAVAEGFAPSNPVEGLKPVRSGAKDRRVRRPFTREELAGVFAICDGDWRILVMAGLQTGQRLGDIVRMQWGELDLERGLWEPVTGKTGAVLRIPLRGDLVEALRARRGERPGGGDVFPDLVARLERCQGRVGFLSTAFSDLLFRAGLRRYSPHDRVAKNGKKAELVAGGSDRREQQDLCFHSLRHTARTWLEESGQPKSVIDALMGHEGATGRIYTSVSTEAMRVAAEVLPRMEDLLPKKE